MVGVGASGGPLGKDPIEVRAPDTDATPDPYRRESALIDPLSGLLSDGAFSTPPKMPVIPAGIAVVGDWQRGATLSVRQAINARTSDADQDDFIRNAVKILHAHVDDIQVVCIELPMAGTLEQLIRVAD